MRDLERGRRFYERQGVGLGDYFLNSLFSDIDGLLVHAGVHRVVFGFHRLLSKRFPFAVYYRTSGEIIEVWRILDCRQNPDRVSNALKEVPRSI